VRAVFDSSALLAMLWGEPGADAAEALVEDSAISAVNMAEVSSKLFDHGANNDVVQAFLTRTRIRVIPYDEKQAFRTGELRLPTRAFGLSIGDRACLGLAEAENATAVTADRNWLGLNLGIDVKTIR
jgi:ribonuclease VapC